MNIILFLGLLLIAGLAATRATRLIHLPNVTGYLIIGLIVAVICIMVDNFAPIDSTSTSLTSQLNSMNTFISAIALGFIALTIGEEFKLSKLKAFGSKIIVITIIQAFSALILVDAVLLIACACFNLNPSIAICLGAIATATAPAATIMVIHQYKARGPLVDILLPVVAFDDAIGLVAFAISLSISKLFVGTSSINLISILVVPLIEIFGSIILGGILGFLMHLFIKFFKSRNNHMIVIIAFTILGVGLIQLLNQIVLEGERLEFSSLLCCMMIGAVYVNIAKNEEKPIITRDFELMDRWEQFLLTLFFVLSGAHLGIAGYDILTNNDISLLLPIIIVFILYLVFRSLGKYFGAFIGSKITNQTSTIKKFLGITLLPQAGVAIGMANQISNIESFKANNIGSIILTVTLCAILIYELVGPLLTKMALNRAGEIPEEEK